MRCVGCGERTPARRAGRNVVEGLGYVCPVCTEVLPIVWETALENVREAQRAIDTFIADIEETHRRNALTAAHGRGKQAL